MTYRERELRTLGFLPLVDRGAVEETFYPWSLTRERFKAEGMPADIADGAGDNTNNPRAARAEKYLPVSWGEGVLAYERWLGFDAVRRIHFVLPFRRFPEEVLEDCPDYRVRRELSGRLMRLDKRTGLETEHRQVVETVADWERLCGDAERELAACFTDEAIRAAYGPVAREREELGYPVRLNLEGFFWAPRELLGITPHLLAFYDAPALLHSINEYVLKVYSTALMKVLDIVTPDLVYIMEDLSGKNGPMISGEMFDEFVGGYYRRLIPLLRARGVSNVFVDTDGDFNQIIPNFIAAGVDGFLPMDVNAGMDIVKVRERYPKLKFIGGYNKLCIAGGKEAIDREFARIMPVIRGGGYIVGADHQVAPSTSLENYRYYIARLREAMRFAGVDA